jgi:hypothetical protein
VFKKFFNSMWSQDGAPRPATPEDVAQGKAIFSVPGNVSKVYDLGVPLPAPGRVKRPILAGKATVAEPGIPITVVQAQTGPKGTIMLGILIAGRKVVCTMDDVELDGELT